MSLIIVLTLKKGGGGINFNSGMTIVMKVYVGFTSTCLKSMNAVGYILELFCS